MRYSRCSYMDDRLRMRSPQRRLVGILVLGIEARYERPRPIWKKVEAGQRSQLIWRMRYAPTGFEHGDRGMKHVQLSLDREQSNPCYRAVDVSKKGKQREEEQTYPSIAIKRHGTDRRNQSPMCMRICKDVHRVGSSTLVTLSIVDVDTRSNRAASPPRRDFVVDLTRSFPSHPRPLTFHTFT